MELIDRQAAIDALHTWFRDGFNEDKWWNSTHVLAAIEGVPSVQLATDTNVGIKLGTNLAEVSTDCISRQAAIDAIDNFNVFESRGDQIALEIKIDNLPSAQPEQRYTEEELRVFQHGISLSLLSKRSSQHWQYDEDTATEIKFLERLYEKVVADMRGEQDGRFN